MREAWTAAVMPKVIGGAVHGWCLRVGYIRRWADNMERSDVRANIRLQDRWEV